MITPRTIATGLVFGSWMVAAVPAGMAAQPTVVGRVSVTPVEQAGNAHSLQMLDVLEAQSAPSPGKSFADVRIISVRPDDASPDFFTATIYDYTLEQGFDVLLDSKGKEISRQALSYQPAVSVGELQDAQAIVNQSSDFQSGLADGSLTIYNAMPPWSVDLEGRRLINVGVMSRAEAAHPLDANEILSVHIPTGKIVRYESRAPSNARAGLLACGPPSSGCGASSGSCTSSYHVEWPAVNPVWKFNVRHPSCTTTGTIGQADGTGLELTDVYYKDKLVLQNAEMPVLNVKYVGDACGPYRDWLNSEDCFQATGTDVPAAGSGIRVTTGNPTPGTLCENDVDTGNFKGVAIHDQGSSLWLLTETAAGWYRYVMEWRLDMDGSIEPVFGFGATSNNCTCNAHYHHAYWRFEWALDGTSGDTATGITTLERRHAGTTDVYDPVPTENTFVRPSVASETDWFRVRNPSTGTAYILKPGTLDGNATGDAYGKWDLAALAYGTGQINDPNGSDTSVFAGTWANGEALGTTKRLVTWYHATYDHDDPGGSGEPCELVGPKFVYVSPCAGSVSLDHNVYACGSSVAITVDDGDLRNTGTLNVAVSSTTESTSETKTLVETPLGSGHFTAMMATMTGAPVHGDGKISVTDGDTVNVHYVDASNCGTPNVGMDKSASIDCARPVLANISVSGITGNSANVQWTTNESATSVVHWGTAPPGAGVVSDSDPHTAHFVPLTGLTACTTYYYWLESADVAGNNTASNSGGGYFAFTTGQNVQPNYLSSGGPVAIPDNSSAGVTSTINVSDANTVLDANVKVNITHTYDNDLTLSLLTPTNASIVLSNRRGGQNDNFTNTVFDDEAATPISSGSAPFTGSFKPDGLLSGADGLGAAGAWKLKVVDIAGQDTGTIDNWTLTLTYASQSCSPQGAPPPAPDGVVGSAMTAQRTSPSGSSMHVGWDVSTCGAKNYHLIYGPLGQVSTYTLGGGVCGLGPLGSYNWSGVSAGNLWFVVVGDDAAGTESSWGKRTGGAERGGATPSGMCGNTARNNGGTCP